MFIPELLCSTSKLFFQRNTLNFKKSFPLRVFVFFAQILFVKITPIEAVFLKKEVFSRIIPTKLTPNSASAYIESLIDIFRSSLPRFMGHKNKATSMLVLKLCWQELSSWYWRGFRLNGFLGVRTVPISLFVFETGFVEQSLFRWCKLE